MLHIVYWIRKYEIPLFAMTVVLSDFDVPLSNPEAVRKLAQRLDTLVNSSKHKRKRRSRSRAGARHASAHRPFSLLSPTSSSSAASWPTLYDRLVRRQAALDTVHMNW